MRKVLLLPVILILTASVAVSGCATGGGSRASEKLIVQAATMKFIEAGDRASRAERIARAADEARVWLDSEGVTVANLQIAMLERIAVADIEPSDKLLASALVEVVVVELNARIGDGIVSPEKRATVNSVLGWIEQAAAFY